MRMQNCLMSKLESTVDTYPTCRLLHVGAGYKGHQLRESNVLTGGMFLSKIGTLWKTLSINYSTF